MKQLFRKSNLLHIRTNEGEFEVINPTAIGFSVVISDTMESFLNRFIKPGERIEWPGGIEKVCSCECQVKPMFCFFDCQQDKTIRIRLLPKEEKKEPFVKALDDIQKIENLSVNNSAHSYTESDYKEPQDKEQLIGLIIDDFKNGKEIFVPAVESSEPQEKLKKGDAGFKWFTCPTCDGRGSVPQDSAPSESQEEIWKKHIQQEELWDDAISIGESEKSRKSAIHKIMKYFTITRNP